jgi:hypothetical protein
MNPLSRLISLLDRGAEILACDSVNSGFPSGFRLALESIERVQK